MKKKLLAPLLPVLILAIGLTGCETDMSAPEALSLQTKNAVEVLPADARFVGMVNVRDLRSEVFGDEPFAFDRMNGEFAARIREFIEATGFDPVNDLHEIYVAADPDEGDLVDLVVYADYDRDRFEAFVDEQLPDEIDRTTYAGVTIYRAGDAERHVYFALANDDMIVASSRETRVHAMLDRLSGRLSALKDNAETMRLVRQSAGGDAWFVACDVGREEWAEHGGKFGDEMARIAQTIRDVALSMTMTDDGVTGTVTLVPKEDVSADDLAALARGLISAVKASEKVDDEALRALDAVEVRTDAGVVRITAKVDRGMIEKFRNRKS
ncbi:hypothetical protein [Rhodocaloribacter sp.]